MEYSQVIKQLTWKFLVPVFEKEVFTTIELMQAMEKAWWCYMDVHYDANPDKLPKMTFQYAVKKLMDNIKANYPKSLAKFPELNVNKMYVEYKRYMVLTPSNGCIILSRDLNHCIVVKSFNKNLWNFPKGKMNPGETEGQCAIREVYEEIGLDVSELIDTSNFIEHVSKEGKRIKLFIIPYVDKNTTVLKCNTQKEIGDIKWIPIYSIPFHWHKVSKFNRHIWPLTRFERSLRTWIANTRRLVS